MDALHLPADWVSLLSTPVWLKLLCYFNGQQWGHCSVTSHKNQPFKYTFILLRHAILRYMFFFSSPFFSQNETLEREIIIFICACTSWIRLQTFCCLSVDSAKNKHNTLNPYNAGLLMPPFGGVYFVVAMQQHNFVLLTKTNKWTKNLYTVSLVTQFQIVGMKR